ncbi:transglycosylase SLT domain-containing protein [Streptomyces sp. NPDC048172]|uniref:transglycosylase SLT domain-containing protein n=1 Tax=Streptomyces sp. NPDC048172 TaxID=3365505 RepID=UPI00370FCA72
MSEDNEEGKNTTVAVAGTAGGLTLVGCLLPLFAVILVFGGIMIVLSNTILLPLKIVCELGLCSTPDMDKFFNKDDGDKLAEAFNGDGKGDLNKKAVPPDYVDAIKNAGKECPQIGPIVIAAQIHQASGFKEKQVGPDGAEGISQLPPDKFEEFGEDDDDNGETSALDAEDSIMAQARYMCSLAEDVDEIAENKRDKEGKKVEVDDPERLDMTLSAYRLGIEAVEKANGVPKDEDAKTYVASVRTWFSLYAGVIKVPDDKPYPTPTPVETSPAPTNTGPSPKPDDGQ